MIIKTSITNFYMKSYYELQCLRLPGRDGCYRYRRCPHGLSLKPDKKVREVVEKLKQEKSKKIIEHQTVECTWGTYTIIQESLGYIIKKIVVCLQQKLNIQIHYHRSDHWIVVRVMAKITNREKEVLVHENESTYMPKATLHRLGNPGLLHCIN